MTATAGMTAEELLSLDFPNKRTELVRGVLVVREPAGFQHGAVAAELLALLRNYVLEHELGRVFAAETGFTIARDPDTVRAADVAFIRKDRLPDPPPAGFAEMAPDLVVEVLSPGDRPGAVLAKLGEWLEAGTRLVWVVDLQPRSVRVYRADGSQSNLDTDETLDAEDVIPGFTLQVDSIL